MTSPKFARLASQVLGDGEKRFDDDPPAPAPAARAAAIAAIEQAIRTKSRRRMMRRSGFGALAFAATAALAFGAWHARAPHVSPAASIASQVAPTLAPSAQALAIAHPSGDGASLALIDTQSAPMVEGQRLAAGSRVVAKPGGARASRVRDRDAAHSGGRRRSHD